MPHSDIHLAKKFVSKSQRARDLGHEFEISFTTFKRCRSRKTCALTGLKMSLDNSSVDRIDNRFGYIEGNVAGVREDINKLKGQIESFIGQTKDLEWKHIKKMVDATVAHLEKNND